MAAKLLGDIYLKKKSMQGRFSANQLNFIGTEREKNSILIYRDSLNYKSRFKMSGNSDDLQQFLNFPLLFNTAPSVH